jgi:hypothetical protein
MTVSTVTFRIAFRHGFLPRWVERPLFAGGLFLLLCAPTLAQLTPQPPPLRPDGTYESPEREDGSQVIQIGSDTVARKDDKDSPWVIETKECNDPPNFETVQVVKTIKRKECRADLQHGNKLFFYEVTYAEFTCSKVPPLHRRFNMSFKKLGPCTADDYAQSKSEADRLWNETEGTNGWQSKDDVVVVSVPTGNDGGGGSGGDVFGGGGGTACHHDGLKPVMVSWFPPDSSVWYVIWEDKDCKTHIAAYRKDGSKDWLDPPYESGVVPDMPTEVAGRPLKGWGPFKSDTADEGTGQPGEKKSTTTEQDTKPTDSKPSDKKTTEAKGGGGVQHSSGQGTTKKKSARRKGDEKGASSRRVVSPDAQAEDAAGTGLSIASGVLRDRHLGTRREGGMRETQNPRRGITGGDSGIGGFGLRF